MFICSYYALAGENDRPGFARSTEKAKFREEAISNNALAK
jgi:hypothetical protein